MKMAIEFKPYNSRTPMKFQTGDLQTTGPALLAFNAERWADKVWMRKKEYGFWVEYTWKQGFDIIRNFSSGLVGLGLEYGDRVAIVGDSDPHWFWAELSVQCTGGAVVGLFTDSTPDEINHILQDCKPSFIIAQDQEQVDKLLSIIDKVPFVKQIIYWNSAGLRHYDVSILMSFEEVAQLGEQNNSLSPMHFESRIDQVNPDDLSLLIYTSGTTGLPKGVMFSWSCLFIGSIKTLFANPVNDRDDFVSFTLPGWTGEQLFGLIPSLLTGMHLNFAEKPETTQHDFREIGPQLVFNPSRIWEGMASSIQHRISQTHWPKRMMYKIFLPVGYRWADLVLNRIEPNILWKLLHRISYWMVFHQIKDRYGLSRLKSAFTGGAILGPDLFRFFIGLGIDLRQVYSPTETLGGTIHYVGEVKVETVGQPVPGSEFRIMDDGEIFICSDSIFQGYYGKPEATAKVFSGRWYLTGDAGYIDDEGHIIYTDRVEFMGQMSDGTKFPPQYIESRLKFSPYIKDAFVVGNRTTQFLTVIINIDFDNVGHWAERKNIAYTTFAELSQKTEICKLIAIEIQKVNALLPERFRIYRYANLHKEFDPDEGEMTRTRKIRREHVENTYSQLIEVLYSDTTEIPIETPIRYADGTTGISRSRIKINRLETVVS